MTPPMDDDVMALSSFATERASAITGVSKRQLATWHRSGFFRAEEIGGSHIYSFRQLIELRALAKIRTRDTGWRYAVDTLVAAGATPPVDTSRAASLAAWVAVELARVTRKVRHPGNLKYAFALSEGARKDLPPSRPYPRLPRPVCVPFEGRAVA